MNQLAPVAQIEPLSRETFERFRSLIYEKTNIYMRDSKQTLVSNRLRKRLLALGLRSYDQYYEYLTRDPMGASEMQHFIDAVSTNETYFFREMGHFRALVDRVLPELLARRPRLTIWSAGCSTGEEPYTIRILAAEALGARAAGIAILATDINRGVIDAAREGRYRERSLRLVPPEVLERYFEPAEDGSRRVRRELAESIDFRVHALLKEAPPARSFDVIFCRNVMIYFDKPTQNRLVDEYFEQVLAADGYLFIGHSESLAGTSRKFRLVRGLGAPIYQKLGGGGS